MTQTQGGSALASRELAGRLLSGDEAAKAAMSAADRHAVAWALKDACYAAWSSEPQETARAAETLRALCDDADDGSCEDEHAQTIAALADWTEGIAHVSRGEMNEATRSLDNAARAFQRLGEPHRAAETQVPKIIALSMLGRHDDAVACAEQARESFVAHGDLLAAGKVVLNLGSLNLRRDAYAEAIRHYREAAVLLARAGAREHSIMADIGAGDALSALADFDAALHLYARARMRAHAHGYAVLEAHVEESIALVELARGRYREALSGLERSRRCYESLAMPQQLATAEKQLGDAYLELGLLPQALARFDSAAAHFGAIDMPDDEAWTHAQTARAFALLGDGSRAARSLAQAKVLFEAQCNRVGLGMAALIDAELALGNGDALHAAARAADGHAELSTSGFVEGALRAEVLRGRALLAAGDANAAGVIFASARARAVDLQLQRILLDGNVGLGLVALSLGDRARARGWFEQSVELFEELRRALPADELRIAFHADHLQPYQALLQLALADHAESPTVARAGGVLRRLDRFRATSLSELESPADVDDAATTALRTRVNWLHRRSVRLQDEGTSTTFVREELRRTELELLEHLRRRRFAMHSPAALARADDLDVEALQAALRTDEALVEYGVAHDELFACVVTHADVRIVRRVAGWPEVRDGVRDVRFQMDALRYGSAMPARHLPLLMDRAQSRLGRLHELIWAPLEPALGQVTRVLVVPHDVLATVPFAALHGSGRTIAEHFELALAPSARVAFGRLGLRGFRTGCLLAVGESTRLAHAAHEARHVAALFTNASVLVDQAATVDTLCRLATDADAIHLACHGEFRADNARFSSLHLSDAPLTVERIEKLRLRPAIVVLSACETGMADAVVGDEMIGLVRAFLVAGAQRVIAALWPVDDATTIAFMTHFYSKLRDGAHAAAALRAAQLESRKHHPHPFHWAAFTLHGGW